LDSYAARSIGGGKEMTDTIDCSYCESCGRKYIDNRTRESKLIEFFAWLRKNQFRRGANDDMAFRRGWDSAMRALEGLRQE
jgi:hypothetical protein